MVFFRYGMEINSTELAGWLRRDQSVFILAGDTFGMDRYFRVGIGAETAYLETGLERIGSAIRDRFGY
jgi:aspartate/methionine/tyrosine aminotransferase